MTSKPCDEPTRLSKEPGFIAVDIFQQPAHNLPGRTPGLLAYLHIENGVEKVVRLLLLDDLARGFANTRPFCGNANVFAYRAFPPSQSSGHIEHYRQELAERLSLYAKLSVKYKAPQVVWPFDESASLPPV